MLKKLLVSGALAAGIVAVPATAFADSCSNVSRPAPPCDMSCTAPVVVGNWIWLPSLASIGITGLPPVWGFSPPGTPDSVDFSLPDANGNYTNGYTISLLGHSANCPTPIPARQTSHGIQNPECA